MKHSVSRNALSAGVFKATEQLIKENEALLSEYIDQLLWWNQRINLISRDVSRETVWKHIKHSLLIVQSPAFQETTNVIDAGTGGGLPGIPLGICAPTHSVLLNDIVSKKVMADKQMVHKLGLKNVTTAAGSIGKVLVKNPFLLITKHAFKIDQLFGLAEHLPWSKMIFYKGADFEEELSGIHTSLSLQVYDLYKNSGDSFYRDKVIIEVTR